MTDPEQGGELEQIAAEIDAVDEDLSFERQLIQRRSLLLQHWPTIRAALERQAKLEAALRRIATFAEAGMPLATQWMHDASDLIRIREVAREALLADPLAETGGEEMTASPS